MEKMKALSIAQQRKLTTIESDLEKAITVLGMVVSAMNLPAGRAERVLAGKILMKVSEACTRAEKITGFPVLVAIKSEPGYVRAYFFPLGEEPPQFSDFSYLLKEGHNA